MNTPTNERNDRTPQVRPATRHRGPCGPRRPCWRRECRQRFASLPTLEVLADVVIARCHGATYHVGDPLLGRLAS